MKTYPKERESSILNKIYKEFSRRSPRNVKTFSNFLESIMKKTNGYVNLDFLDVANWDFISGYKIDKKENLVFIYWHDYRNADESEEEREVRKMMRPADVYGLIFIFQDFIPIPIRGITLFTFRGYSLSKKEVIKIIKELSDEYHIIKDDGNFTIEISCKINNEWHIYNFLNTPIYSALILPKDIDIIPIRSRNLLFAINLSNSRNRIIKVNKQLSDKGIDYEEISALGNTLRRIMESILKIECCYRSEQISVQKSYSDLLLGDLIKILKQFRNEKEIQNLNKIVRYSNDMSHDIGKKVIRKNAIELSKLIWNYSEVLDLEIHTNPFPGDMWS